MKVLIVFTHPNSTSFNHALLDKVSAGLVQSGHEVKVKNLYQENFNPVLDSEDLSQLHQGNIPERIANEQKDLLWAKGLVFIYPLWCLPHLQCSKGGLMSSSAMVLPLNILMKALKVY